MLISSLWPDTGSLPTVALSGRVAVDDNESLETVDSGGTVDILPEPGAEAGDCVEAVNIQPAELSKTTSDVIVNIRKQLCLFISTGGI